MKCMLCLCSAFVLFSGETNAMYLQRNDNQKTLIAEVSAAETTLLFSSNLNDIINGVELGADVNMDNRRCGTTPLTCAIEKNSEEIVTYLLNHGADPNKETIYGFLPLQMALMCRNLNLIKILVDKGADPYLNNRSGRSAISLAQMILKNETNIKGKAWLAEVIKIFEDSSSNPKGPTLFSSNINSIIACVERGDDVNMDNRRCGTTPLTCAIEKNSEEIVTYLLNHGADPNKETIQGFLPLQMALRCRNLNLIKILMDKGADPYLNNRSGRSAISLAQMILKNETNIKGKAWLAEVIKIFEEGSTSSSSSSVWSEISKFFGF